ncbi:sodium/hydrogen exchanger family protein [Formosimonas limnophila]|uniref:Sodium/hydrogen exchanger family protein n=1 Tax=Formosimonas limnophila TaxID=1384487 RepID=A0A8J3CHB3_9BURK|nr:cation:proton antiporter [Formosimonas limnophila]GHA73427.1 sodium/hydrogen exchanger family protein [Formosimonas limnophila]
MEGLALIVTLLAIAVLGVVAFRFVHLPPTLGYLTVGVMIGPHAFGLFHDSEAMAHLAEFGIVFLMFTIGLEFSLPKLKSMRRVVLGLGGSQLAGTMAVAVLLGLLINWFLSAELQMGWADWLVLGGVLAMSSTAIVMKTLTERLELDTPHGRNVFGILLFQDLAVVPLLILVPALGQSGENLAWLMTIGLLKTMLVLALLLGLGQKPMHAWLTLVAQRRSQELFMLNLFLMTLGFALLTEMTGLSLALGAFVAGMLISETEFRVQVEEDILPFKDILLGFFFVTMGMQLDLSVVVTQLGGVLLTLVLIVGFKFAIIAALAYFFGSSSADAVRTGIALAQAGEFGLVLLSLALQNQLLNPSIAQWVLAAMLISMFLTPFMLAHADKLVLRFTQSEWLVQSLQLTTLASHTIEAKDHVIIAGFGRSGTDLGKLLGGQNIPYMGIDNDPERVQKAVLQGHDVVYGDITRKESLVAAGVTRARALVVAYVEPRIALHVLHHIKELNPDLPVIVRTLDDAYLEQLQAAGAVAVVPEILEGSLVLATQTMLTVGVASNDVLHFIAEQRRGRYDLLRQHFESDEPFGLSSSTPESVNGSPTSPARRESSQPEQVLEVVLRDESLWLDQPIDTLPLQVWRVRLLSVVRAGVLLDLAFNPNIIEHDVLTFSGMPHDVQHAVRALNGDV